MKLRVLVGSGDRIMSLTLPFAVLGIVLAMAYWLLTSLFAAIGTAGLLTPALSAWAPNLLFGAAGLALLLTIRT